TLMPTKSTGVLIAFISSAATFGASAPAAARKDSRVAAFHDRGQVGRVEFARGELGRRDMLGRLDDWDADADVLRRPGLRARARARADRLDRKPVGEQRMMAQLVQPAGWQL